MKVKVRKRKKSPAPVTEEQALLKELDSSNPYTFFVVRELIRNEELRKKFLAFVEQHKLDENDICGNAPSSQFLTHDVGGRGHRNKELSSIAANQTSSGVYVPRIFIDYISGSFNDKDIRKAMENIRKIRNTIRVNGICGNKPSAFERRRNNVKRNNHSAISNRSF